MAKQTNIMRRGNSWVVNLRVNGEKVWESFADRAHGSSRVARDAAETRLAQLQAERRTGTYRPPMEATFREAAEAWFEHGTAQGGKRGQWKATTRRDYRSVLDAHLLPEFGELQLDKVTAQRIEQWRKVKMTPYVDAEGTTRVRLPRRTAEKCVAVLHGIFERARKEYAHPSNPVADVERLGGEQTKAIDFYSPEEVWALVRAAQAVEPDASDGERRRHEQDAAIFLTAAFTGLRRGELVALRVRAVDFAGSTIKVEAGYSGGELSTPKSGKPRAVPMVDEVAQALSRLLDGRGDPGPDELVFPGENGTAYLDASALRRRYAKTQKAAGLRPIRFHDLRHTFGSLAVNRASIVQLQAWMGHADVKTTMRYLHHKSQAGEAALLADAFKPQAPSGVVKAFELATVPQGV